MFGKYQIQILAQRSAILAKVFMVFLSPYNTLKFSTTDCLSLLLLIGGYIHKLTYFAPFFSELEAYSSLVSALRAQGELSKEKRKLLQDLASTLNISMERHRAEVRRAVNDEKLATIAEQ